MAGPGLCVSIPVIFQLFPCNCSKIASSFYEGKKRWVFLRDWTEIFKPSHLTLILRNLTGTLTQSSSSLYSYLDILHQGIVNLILTILSSGLFKERSPHHSPRCCLYFKVINVVTEVLEGPDVGEVDNGGTSAWCS